nr:hypothetical protein [Rhodococcus sp. (in: high G+C Gram-positive bacteria)]
MLLVTAGHHRGPDLSWTQSSQLERLRHPSLGRHTALASPTQVPGAHVGFVGRLIVAEGRHEDLAPNDERYRGAVVR